MPVLNAPVLVATLTAAAAGPPKTTLPFNSRRLRPWLPGYRAAALSTGAAKIAAVARPNDATRVTAFAGDGVTVDPTFTVPSGFVALPFATGDLDEADVTTLLRAILISYAPGDKANAVPVTRINSGGTLAAGQWKTASTTTITIKGTLPANRIYELIVPDSATIYNPLSTGQVVGVTADAAWTALTAGVFNLAIVADFMAARVAEVRMHRVMQ